MKTVLRTAGLRTRDLVFTALIAALPATPLPAA
jgi:hypothetical protein